MLCFNSQEDALLSDVMFLYIDLFIITVFAVVSKFLRLLFIFDTAIFRENLAQ